MFHTVTIIAAISAMSLAVITMLIGIVYLIWDAHKNRPPRFPRRNKHQY